METSTIWSGQWWKMFDCLSLDITIKFSSNLAFTSYSGHIIKPEVSLTTSYRGKRIKGKLHIETTGLDKGSLYWILKLKLNDLNQRFKFNLSIQSMTFMKTIRPFLNQRIGVFKIIPTSQRSKLQRKETPYLASSTKYKKSTWSGRSHLNPNKQQLWITLSRNSEIRQWSQLQVWCQWSNRPSQSPNPKNWRCPSLSAWPSVYCKHDLAYDTIFEFM